MPETPQPQTTDPWKDLPQWFLCQHCHRAHSKSAVKFMGGLYCDGCDEVTESPEAIYFVNGVNAARALERQQHAEALADARACAEEWRMCAGKYLKEQDTLKAELAHATRQQAQKREERKETEAAMVGCADSWSVRAEKAEAELADVDRHLSNRLALDRASHRLSKITVLIKVAAEVDPKAALAKAESQLAAQAREIEALKAVNTSLERHAREGEARWTPLDHEATVARLTEENASLKADNVDAALASTPPQAPTP